MIMTVESAYGSLMEISPYYNNPHDAVYLEKDLTGLRARPRA